MFTYDKRVFVSFFAFGLLNNVLYVVILSAAIDLVGSATPKAVVLLADIFPSLTIKILAPFFIHAIPYRTRLWLLVALSSIGMLIISFFNSIPLRVIGIMMALLSLGLGELTFLLLTHYYRGTMSIGGFLSGTGAAGLGGSFFFMLMTNILGISVAVTLFVCSVLPGGFVVVFYGLLPTIEDPYETLENIHNSNELNGRVDTDVESFNDNFNARDERVTNIDGFENVNSIRPNSFYASFRSTLAKIQPLFVPYMVPLCLVYISEYVINQGISPTLLFDLDTLPHWLFSTYRDIYVVYGFLYQLGVFVSRSLVNFGIRIRHLHWLSFLQFANVVILLVQSMYDKPFGSIWPLLAVIFYEGLLGGASYINTFVSVSEDVPKNRREFSMGAVSISDSFGVMVAGCINWFLEVRLCDMQVARGRNWCRA